MGASLSGTIPITVQSICKKRNPRVTPDTLVGALEILKILTELVETDQDPGISTQARRKVKSI